MVAAIAAGNTMLVKSGSEDCSPEFAKLCEQLFPKYLDNGTEYWPWGRCMPLMTNLAVL